MFKQRCLMSGDHSFTVLSCHSYPVKQTSLIASNCVTFKSSMRTCISWDCLWQVNGVKNYTKDVVVGATQYSLAAIQGVKDKSLETVGSLLQTPYGQVVAAHVDTMVAMTDNYVEKYLPPTEEGGCPFIDLPLVS